LVQTLQNPDAHDTFETFGRWIEVRDSLQGKSKDGDEWGSPTFYS